MWTWNEIEYHLWERRGAKLAARLRRGLAGLVRSLDGSRDRPQARKETRPMDAPTIPQLSAASMGRLLMSKLDRESTEAIVAAVREEVAKEVYEQAVTEARAELEEAFATRRERLLDQLAKDKQVIERDAEARVDVEVEAALRDERQDWEDRLEAVRTQRRDALARAQEAEAAVTAMVTELVGGVDQRAVYLFSGGQGLRSLDKAAVNRVLAKAGVVLKSKATVSERTVAVLVEPGRVVGHHLFWLTKVTPPGVIDEAEDTDAPDKSA